MKKITLYDIAKAVKLLKTDMPPNKTKEYFWGWLETDSVGYIISIKFKRNQIKEVKRFLNMNFRYEKLYDTKLEEVYGIKVLNTIRINR